MRVATDALSDEGLQNLTMALAELKPRNLFDGRENEMTRRFFYQNRPNCLQATLRRPFRQHSEPWKKQFKCWFDSRATEWELIVAKSLKFNFELCTFVWILSSQTTWGTLTYAIWP